MSPAHRNRWIKQLAAQQGLDGCGVAQAGPAPRRDYLRAWLDAGRAGTMAYLHRHFAQRTDPRVLLEGARSVVMVAISYHHPSEQRRPAGQDGAAAPRAHPPPSDAPSGAGRVAMYAWGQDYHVVLKRKLAPLAEAIADEGRLAGEPAAVKVCVDTAPLLEREFAALAGLGWIGKNTLVLHPHLGSDIFLGAIVTTLHIAADEPMPDHCGTCTRCLEACPTQAFPEPYRMDASRCISYLTIERREPIPREFHSAIGDWVFGCDVCQQVCPFNQDAPVTKETAFAPMPHAPRLDLQTVLAWTPEDYRRALGPTAVTRARLDMLKRNAQIVLDNRRAASASGQQPHGR